MIPWGSLIISVPGKVWWRQVLINHVSYNTSLNEANSPVGTQLTLPFSSPCQSCEVYSQTHLQLPVGHNTELLTTIVPQIPQAAAIFTIHSQEIIFENELVKQYCHSGDINGNASVVSWNMIFNLLPWLHCWKEKYPVSKFKGIAWETLVLTCIKPVQHLVDQDVD